MFPKLSTTLLGAVAPVCLIATTLIPSAARAQQTAAPFADSAPAAASLEEISVSATGVPTPVAQTGSSVTVLTSETLEAQQRRTVSDALQQVPGLNVVQAGGPGAQTSIFIRGSNSNHVKVLVDGIDASDPSIPLGAFNFGNLLTDDLERIEVLRGPQSGLYGSDAIGGVISLTTKRGQGPARASIRLEGGSFGTFNQSGRISGAQEGFDYSVVVSHYRAERIPVTPPELVPIGGRRNPNFYDNKTVSAKFGFQVTDEFRINSVTRFTDAQLLFTGEDFSTFPATPANFRSISDVSQLYLRNEAEWTPFTGFHHVFGVNYSNLFSLNQGPLDPLATPDATAGLGERLRFDYRGDYALAPGHLLLWGAGREEERLKTTDPNPFGAGSLRASNGNTFGFFELQSAVLDRAFLVGNVRHDANDQFGGATTFRVAPSYILPFTESRLKASVGTGFKAPTLSQLYQDFPAFNFFGNPNLRPEESLGFDGGLEQPIGDRIVVGGLYYENDFTNLINANASFTSYENVGRAKSYGAEAFVAVKFTEELSARVDYTNTVTKNEITNQELLRRPRHKGSATVFWTPMPGLTLSGTVIVLGPFVDGNRDFSIPRLKNPGFTVVNLAVNYDLGERWSVFGRIDNLFDKRYENPTGFLGPGLAVYGGVRLNSF